jgi:four helix bundle protein
MGYRSFEEMPLWRRAHGLAVQVHEVTASFPKQEVYGLTSQVRRAAVSVPANVAEAFGRYHYRDKLRFYYNGRGSAYEVKSHLLYARDVGYVDGDLLHELVEELDGVVHELNKVIAAIRRRLGKSNSRS